VAHERLPHERKEIAMLSVLIGVLIICVVGAICFWAIDKFVNESRLANLLKLLVLLICLAAILQRVLPLAGVNWL
jgi:high-affinity K+ transport system ATPase subunit B